MGRTVAKVVGTVAAVVTLFVPGLQAYGVTFFTGSAFAFTVPLASLLTTVAAISVSIGFAPDDIDINVAQTLAEDLPEPAELLEDLRWR